MTEYTHEQLEELLTRVAMNPDAIGQLTEEEIMALHGHVSVFGVSPKQDVAQPSCFANLSIVNWRRRYLEQLLTCALVGYLHRTMAEFEPEEELEAIAAKYEGADREEKSRQVVAAARSVIARFLAKNFEFNPDYHLRSAKTPATDDPERDRAAAKLADIRASCQQSYTARPAEDTVHSAHAAAAAALAAIGRVEAVSPDSIVILAQIKAELAAKLADLGPVVAPSHAAAANAPTPPADVFHHFRRYFDNHFETLQMLTTALYSTKPDIEFSVKLYGAWDNEAAAKEHREKNNKTFTHDVCTIESGGITLLGPFKENRDRIEYYNQHTEVLRELEEFAKRDAELGKDLIKRQVQRKKDKSVREVGPDAPGLAKFTKVSSDTANRTGRVLTRDEEEKLGQIRAKIEDAAVPDGAIQMNVFRTELGVDGEQKLVRGKFYTEAEAPTQESEMTAAVARSRRAKKRKHKKPTDVTLPPK